MLPSGGVLMSDVCRVNIIEGEPNDRQMTTGNHTVRDIYCCKCGTTLGWKYVRDFSSPRCYYFLLTEVCRWAGQSVRIVPEIQRGKVHS